MCSLLVSSRQLLRPCWKQHIRAYIVSRKPLKKFKPTSSIDQFKQELVPKQRRVTASDEANRIADYEEQLRSSSVHFRRKTLARDRYVQGDKSREDLIQPSDDGVDDDDDTQADLEQMKAKFPSFKRISGRDQNSPSLKSLKKIFLPHHSPKSNDTFCLEGQRLIGEALKVGLRPTTLVFSRKNLISNIPVELLKQTKLVQIPYRNIEAWSALSTPPGLMAVFSKSEVTQSVTAAPDCLPIHLLLDNIRGPDNLGALLRLGCAVGCKQIIALKGCVDIWNPKAIRAAAGAHFRVPILVNATWDVLHRHLPTSFQTVVADLAQNCVAGDGTETGGEKLLYELQKEEVAFRVQDPNDSQHFCEDSYNDEELLNRFMAVNLPSTPYSRMCLPTCDSLLVIVGGETLGISREAHKFAVTHHGQTAFIPLRNSIESLNVVSAASVILFQLQSLFRQLHPDA